MNKYPLASVNEEYCYDNIENVEERKKVLRKFGKYEQTRSAWVMYDPHNLQHFSYIRSRENLEEAVLKGRNKSNSK
jgi:hypothetical protein